MLNFPTASKHDLKCLATHGTIGHLDLKQPPTKRKPFASILSHEFLSKVEIILQESTFEAFGEELFEEAFAPNYSRVIMPPSAIFEMSFLSEYIKKRNILMLSEGRVGVENVFTLHEGVLRLSLDKESYERLGLSGQPEGIKGRRGTRPRWVVEINLRLPSMLHGKKGFDKIVYALKKHLAAPVTWLLCSLDSAPNPDPIDVYFPTRIECTPRVLRDIKSIQPSLKPPISSDSLYGQSFEDFAYEIHEWLSLLALESPRLNGKDMIDPCLSRYSLSNPVDTSGLVKITWLGFFSPIWAHKIFLKAVLKTMPDAWFSCYVGGFSEGWYKSGGVKDCRILKVPCTLNEFVLWETIQ